MTDRSPHRHEVDYFRDRPEPLRFDVLDHVQCPRCGSGEVWQPMQTMDMPMVDSCLRCGLTAPSSEYRE